MNFIFFILSLVLTNAKLVEIQTPISISYVYDQKHNLEHKGTNTQWMCSQIDSQTRTNKAMTFQFTVSSKQQIEVSTCHETTSFPSRLVISQSYDNDYVSQCIDAINGDPNGQCYGHRSKLIFTAEKSTKYYVTVMGLSDDEIGQFRITIKTYSNPSSYFCDEAMEITLPKSVSAVVTSSMEYIGNAHGLKRGFWFKFAATKTTHVIDTCNKNTQYPTTIYLYNDKVDTSMKCMSDMPIVEVSDGCGSSARLFYDKFEVGKTYYVFVFFTEDSTSNPVTGSLEITFRTNGGDNYECQNAYTITEKPFNVIVDMRGYTPFSSPCFLSTNDYGMFYSIRGDGKRYVFHTCFTGSTGNDKTRVELISGDCGGCIEETGTQCGNDEMITTYLEDGKLYKFRVVTTNPQNKVRVGLMQVDSNDNYECAHARIMNMTDLGDQYTQHMIGSNQQKQTQFDCHDDNKNLLGGWYHYTATKEDITIMHGVYSFKPAEFKGYIATLSSCYSCIESTHEYFISQDLVIPAGQSRFVFATTIRQQGVGNKFGAFMYWAVRSTNRGGSYANAYTVSAPFTGLFAIGEHQLTIECDHSIPNLRTFPAIAIKYEQPKETTYTASTCGSETVVSTMIEIATETSTDNVYDCFATNDINDCGYGSTITTSGQNTYYALVGINPYSPETKSVLRFNLYEDKEEPSSRCKYAETITSIPSQYYSYTSKAAPSSSTCNILADGLKGKWFVYTPSNDVVLSILTDDVSTFNTQIGVYKSCQEIDDDSVPSECVKGASSHETPVGQHGTHLEVEMKKDQTYYIFVGGATTSESGMMRVKFAYSENGNNGDDGLTGGQIFGVVFASLILVVLLVGFSIVVGYMVYNKLHQNQSRFNAF